MSDIVASLCGFPLTDVVAFACAMTDDGTGSEIGLSVAVVDADGERVMCTEVTPSHTPSQQADDALPSQPLEMDFAAEALVQALSGEHLVVVFDEHADLETARLCVPALADAECHVFSLHDKYPSYVAAVGALQRAAERLGVAASYADVLGRARACAACFRELMAEQEEASAEPEHEEAPAEQEQVPSILTAGIETLGVGHTFGPDPEERLPEPFASAIQEEVPQPFEPAAVEPVPEAAQAESGDASTDVPAADEPAFDMAATTVLPSLKATPVAPEAAPDAAQEAASAAPEAAPVTDADTQPAANEAEVAKAPGKAASKMPAFVEGIRTKLEQVIASPRFAKVAKYIDTPGKLAAIGACLIVFVVALLVLLVSSCTNRSQQTPPTVAEQTRQGQTFFDAIVVDVPPTWEAEESAYDSAYIYTDDDGIVFLRHLSLDDIYATSIDDVVSELAHDGIDVQGSVPTDSSRMGGAVRRRYPVSFMLDSEYYGGYMDLTLSGGDAYAVLYAYLDAYPEDVETTVCDWLDGVEYLSTAEPDLAVDDSESDEYGDEEDEDADLGDTSWVQDDLDAETMSFSYQGMSVMLPETWYEDGSQSGSDSITIVNDHGCKATISYEAGAIADEDDLDSAIDTFLYDLGSDYIYDEDTIERLTIGPAKGFAFTANTRGSKKYACAFEVLYSGNDSHTLYIEMPEKVAADILPIAAAAMQSVKLTGATYPSFTDDASDAPSASSSLSSSSDPDLPTTPSRPSTSSLSTSTGTSGSSSSSSTPSGRFSTTTSSPSTQPSTTPTTPTTTPTSTSTSTTPSSSSSGSSTTTTSTDRSSTSGVSPYTPPSTDTTRQDTDARQDGEDETEGTASQRNALRQAQSILDTTPLSHRGLVQQLELDGNTTDDATWAADNCGADWYEQATRKAQSLLDTDAYSYRGLADQLESEGFTAAEAEYGANNCGADWYDQAARKAQSYNESSGYSRESLIQQLEFDGFTDGEAEYGVSTTNL